MNTCKENSYLEKGLWQIHCGLQFIGYIISSWTGIAKASYHERRESYLINPSGCHMFCSWRISHLLFSHAITVHRQESLRRNGVAIMVNKRVGNAVPGCSLKNDRMISVRFQGKPFNITVIQVYAPTSNAEEAEVEQFYED